MTEHITRSSHEYVKHCVHLQTEREYRLAQGKVLVEGKNLVLDLLQRHSPLKLILVEALLPLFQAYSGEIVLVAEHIARKISQLESPEGCFAEYALPVQPSPKSIERGLVLDRLQDPGNVGTLLRTALAFNLKDVFFIEPCCDPWNPKTIRAAKGAQFDLCLQATSWDALATHEGTVYVTDMHGTDIGKISPHDKWLLVLGNEAHGAIVPPSMSPTAISIPMSGPVESLNVAQAGAIALYCLTRHTM